MIEARDWSAIARIERQLSGARLTRAQVRALFELPGAHARVLAQRARPELVLGVYVVVDTPDELYLVNISVARAFQRRGVATFGLRCIEHRARELGHRTIALDVQPSNAAARALYAKLGFKQPRSTARAGVRRADDEFAASTAAASRMTKRLRR